MAAATPSEPHAIVWSSRSRTVEHPASRPISKATAHTKACAALRKGRHAGQIANGPMEQGISESEGRHTEEEEVGGKAAASGL